MKIKIGQRYSGISDNGLYYFFEELAKKETVVKEGYADLGIGTYDNVGKPVFIERGDYQAQLLLFKDTDKYAKPELIKYCEGFKYPSRAFRKNYNKQLTFELLEENYDVFCPVYSPYPYNEIPFKNCRLLPLPYSLPESIFNKGNKNRIIDVLFCGNHARKYYPFRDRFRQIALKMWNVRVLSHDISASYHRKTLKERKGTRQDWNAQVSEYIELLQSSKVMAFDGTVFNYALKKYVECMATGCLILAPIPDNAGFIGLKNGENMVEVNPDNFEEKLTYYLSNEKERKRITNNAYELFLKKHTCKKSVEYLLNNI